MACFVLLCVRRRKNRCIKVAPGGRGVLVKRWHAYGLMFLAILALAGLCLSGAALAGEFPDKSVKIIVPLNPDGGGEQGVRPL